MYWNSSLKQINSKDKVHESCLSTFLSPHMFFSEMFNKEFMLEDATFLILVVILSV